MIAIRYVFLFVLLLTVCPITAQFRISATFYQDTLADWYAVRDQMTWSGADISVDALANGRIWLPLPDEVVWSDSWMHFPVENVADQEMRLALLLHYDDWTIHWQKNGEWQQGQAGQLTPRRFWDSQQHTPVFSSPHTFQFSIPAQSSRTYYIHLGENDTHQPLRPQLINRDAFLTYSTHYFQRTIASQSTVQAALWMMMFYHLFLFFVNRQRAYLAYSAYIFCIALVLFYSFGMHYLTPLGNFPRWSRVVMIGMTYLYFAAYAQFLIHFLHDQNWRADIRKWLSRLSRATILIAVFQMVCLCLPISIFPLSLAYNILLLLAPIGLAGIVWASWLYWKSGERLPRLIALTNVFLMIGGATTTFILLGGRLDWWNLRETSFWGILFLELTILLHLLSFAVSLSYRGLAIERERTRLQELDGLKSRFFASISHEFRTPLTLMLGPVQQLKATINDRSARPYFHLIESNAKRLLQMVNQILDLTRLEAKQFQLEPQVFELTQLARTVLFSFESLAKERNITLSFQADPDTQVVYLDPTKTEQILLNLIDNAIKYNRSDGKIEVISTLNDQSWQLQVSDSGQGIPEAELERIFEMYYRTNSSNLQAHQMSSGIGLAWIKQLVEWQNGTVEVESQVNMGSTFTVRIPLSDLPKDVVVSTPSTLQHPSLPETINEVVTNTDQPTILVVEDHSDIRWFIQNCLQADYQLLIATDGVAGLELAKKEVPDLILTDVMMPKMDGFELTATLKREVITSHVPVIILTGRSSDAHKISGLQTQADDYLTKPFQVEELQLRIRNLLENRKRWLTHHSNGDTSKNATPLLPSMEAQFLQHAREIVATNMSDETFGVEQLGSALHLDRTQLFRKLKALTNENPSYFIRSIRLEKAHELLQSQSATVAEIAFAVGFQSPSYFNRSFKKHFGVTPGEVMSGEQLKGI
ncbi:MAG: response regulator [Bacteroidota bacterium]